MKKYILEYDAGTIAFPYTALIYLISGVSNKLLLINQNRTSQKIFRRNPHDEPKKKA